MPSPHLYPKAVSYNVMSLNGETRLDEVCFALRKERVNIAALQGTRRLLVDRGRGFDVLFSNGFVVISFGHLPHEDIAAGVAIALDLAFYKQEDIARIWAPNKFAKDALGRVGVVRIKRLDFDLTILCAYPPPVDGHGRVRPVTTSVYKCLKHAIDTKGIIPSRSLPLLLLDSNGHVGMTWDKTMKGWYPGSSPSIGTAEPERENVMGKVFRKFLEDVEFAAANTFVGAGKTYASQSSDARTRIDMVCLPVSAFMAGRASPPYVDNKLGDRAQYLVSRYRLDHAPVALHIRIKLEFLEKKT
jgi:hypothetical protein